MTRRYTLNGIRFEWDSDKAVANWQKHGVAFETACEVFFDPLLRTEAAGKDGGEPRRAAVGLSVAWKLLVVVFLERAVLLRIISARPATPAERQRYEDV